jgi:transcriptional regulator with XRE-family HTH domain
MADKVTGPLGPRRRIAAALRRLRDSSGKTLEEVANDLLISSSKLSRLENAQGKPQARDIRDLIQYYSLEGTRDARDLQRWATAAKESGWWTNYDDAALENSLDAHIAYEADALVARVYTLPFLPALLQTTEYSRAIYRDMERRPEDVIRQLIDIREQRQAALRGREGMPPLELVAVTHESTLRQVIGSPTVMHRQLDTLLERSELPNVHLHVLPYNSPLVFSMTCMYAYFEYQEPTEPGQDVVHIETHAGFFSIDGPDEVAKYRQAHHDLVHSALDEAASRTRIRSVRDEFH